MGTAPTPPAEPTAEGLDDDGLTFRVPPYELGYDWPPAATIMVEVGASHDDHGPRALVRDGDRRWLFRRSDDGTLLPLRGRPPRLVRDALVFVGVGEVQCA